MTTINNLIDQVGGIEKARGIVESSYKNAFFGYEDGLFISVEDLRTAIEHHYYGQSEAEELAEYAELQRETMEGGASLKGNFSKALDRAEQLIASREFKVGDLVVLINSSDDSVFEYVEYSKRLNLHFFESKNNYGRSDKDIGEISGELKKIARDFECPVFALAQLNRNLENRPNKRPVNADLKESGDLEQDADIIMFIYRDEVYNKESKDIGTAEIIIGKARNGSTGTVKLATDLARSTFADLSPEYYAMMQGESV